MSTQENLFYAKIPAFAQSSLSHLERDFFGDISIPELLTNYSKLSNTVPTLQHPSSASTVKLQLEESSPVDKVRSREIGTYSTLERTSIIDHYEKEDVEDKVENYTKVNKITKSRPAESHYESIISSDDLANAEQKLKVNSSTITTQTILYTALYRFAPRHSDEIELLVGDMLELVKLHPDLWVECKNQRTGQLGVVPNQYVVLCTETNSAKTPIVKETFRFAPRHSDEIELLVGDMLELVKLHPDLWVECKNQRTGQLGVVPNQYVVLCTETNSAKTPIVKETFRANFIGSVSVRKSAGREVAKEAMSRILSERRRLKVTTVQPVLVEVTGSGVTTHVIDPRQAHIPHIHFSIHLVTYSAVQGTKSLAYIVRDTHQEKYTCYVYETEESVDLVLEIFQKAFDFYKQSFLTETEVKF